MDNDDILRGRLLSRREALTFLGATGALLFLGCSTDASSTTDPTTPTTPNGSTACVVRPELTEGPYYVDEELNRSDVRSDPSTGTVKDGALLALTFNVSRAVGGACTPLSGAVVDIWHCDAAGAYSDVSDPGFNTKGQKWLRGLQATDANGQAKFTTIYPGWYSGRTVHVHFKVRSAAGASQSHEFTSQLFFDDALSDAVFRQAPYAAKGTRNTRNPNDGIYQQGGSQLLLNVTKTGDGYAATFDIALQNV
jgi:protocatechuate 3,4-dioxygenase beta subunit